ncbi:hypothetical protein FIBSPDRAFT_756993 [Athelia psychrophila]|uniref:Ribosomal RNA methyltransferase FtsJ domain-containing protein n=1 Tax=Athelia psychrophila TaxID=1759441 RepID=A0A166A3J1_9AGAM|nr:hypothetical protein FIBSPDRAFT_756993 [Fibularhizoctonia sp. CBS 109695]
MVQGSLEGPRDAPIERPSGSNLLYNSNLPYSVGELLIERGVKEYVALSELKRKGWDDQHIHDHFTQQRHTADTADPQLNDVWFRKMKVIFNEIDAKSGCISLAEQPLNFLDLGCCPGGFSSYILTQNPTATGLGISLDVSKGGHTFMLERNLQSRYNLLFADLTYFALGPPSSPSSSASALPPQIKDRQFSLIILDGHLLRNQEGVRPWDYYRLLIAQFVIGLQGLRDRGTLVVKLSRPDTVRTAKLLYMLDGLSGSNGLVTCKPRSMHASRGTFYAVARNVGHGRIPISAMLEGLQNLWQDLTYGGSDGRGRFLEEEDLDFIVTTENLVGGPDIPNGYLDRLVELASDVWIGQADALRVLLTRHKVPLRQVPVGTSSGIEGKSWRRTT